LAEISTVPARSGRATKRIYTRAAFHTLAAMADEAAGLLVAKGALGCAVVEMTRPGARPLKNVTLEAYFERITQREIETIRHAMAEAGMLATNGAVLGVRRIADPGWATLWQRRFRPFRVGTKFLIVPPWRARREVGRVSIVIQPGQAFGTGHHPTTAGSLRAIEDAIADVRPRTALDVGTGSGILAIAMAALGIHDIVAIDVDPTALDNAEDNAALNHIAERIRFSPVPLASIRHRFDLITANILADTLIELAPRLQKMVAPAGRLILSGILAREVPEVLGRYAPPLKLAARSVNRGWATLVLAR
jgi:ribosomal protein L11 methyltransferase